MGEAPLAVARLHQHESGVNVDYHQTTAEEFAASHPGQFDVVTCMEMLEHVPEPEKIVAACAQALKPGGQAFFSSINRTLKAFLFAIVGGEYILRLLPRDTHTYGKLIRPTELKQWSQKYDMEFARLASLMYNPFTDSFKVAHSKEDVNYMMHFIKR
jgi:2-polyprenyl-6-hydroxyphenyl methylase/3-demethylubiquinone-9 3-methyltransferase